MGHLGRAGDLKGVCTFSRFSRTGEWCDFDIQSIVTAKDEGSERQQWDGVQFLRLW